MGNILTEEEQWPANWVFISWTLEKQTHTNKHNQSNVTYPQGSYSLL